MHPAKTATAGLALLFLGASAASAAEPNIIPMKKDGGVFMVPMTIDGVVTVDCIVDSGAADVNIPRRVFERLAAAGAVSEADYIGTQEYVLADGSTQRGRVFRIRALKVGGIEVKNVTASVGEGSLSGLLGQSFLTRFKSWSVDNVRHALVLVGPPLPAASVRVARREASGGGDNTRSQSGGRGGHREFTPSERIVPAGPSVAQISRHGGDDGAAAAHHSHAVEDADGPPLTAQDGR